MGYSQYPRSYIVPDPTQNPTMADTNTELKPQSLSMTSMARIMDTCDDVTADRSRGEHLDGRRRGERRNKKPIAIRPCMAPRAEKTLLRQHTTLLSRLPLSVGMDDSEHCGY